MAVLNQVVGEAFQVVGRELQRRNLNSGQTSEPSATPTALSQTTSPTPSSTMSTNTSQQNGPTSSPLLFFVALGFGVVFTNLWIIVGVKYCFRYNARNRAIRNGEEVEPIGLDNMPARPHRRRREKKLMSMDEVNERFPLTKYKNWVASRAREGLSTTGGVTAPPSRAGSLRNVDGVMPSSPTGTKQSINTRPNTAGSDRDVSIAPATIMNAHERKSIDAKVAEKDIATSPVEDHNNLEEVKTTAETIDKHPIALSEEEEDEDDHIHTAVPPELLTNPGDSCAICIDTLEDDDDIRGLTCGHAFHAGCLDPWLTSRRACCPLCKADYYTPKPRPEGEATEPERTGRRSRANMPTAPTSAWLGRGNRIMLPGRFGTGPFHVGGARTNGIDNGQEDTGAIQNAQAAVPRRLAPGNPFRGLISRLPGRNRPAPAQPTTEANPSPSQLEAGIVR